MRQPPARTIVLVQLGPGRGDGINHPLLSRHELGRGAGQQPRPTPPEQPNPVEGQLHRGEGAQPRHGRGDGGQLPGPQDRIRNVRHVPPVCMRTQARHPGPLQPIPQCAHGPLGAPIEQKADRQRHPPTVTDPPLPPTGSDLGGQPLVAPPEGTRPLRGCGPRPGPPWQPDNKSVGTNSRSSGRRRRGRPAMAAVPPRRRTGRLATGPAVGGRRRAADAAVRSWGSSPATPCISTRPGALISGVPGCREKRERSVRLRPPLPGRRDHGQDSRRSLEAKPRTG